MPDDQAHADELIPEICKPLYESLIAEGRKPLDIDDATVQAAMRSLIEKGLAVTAAPRNAFLPVSPTAALEHVLIRWLDQAVQNGRRSSEAYDRAIVLQHRLLRQMAARATAACHVIACKEQVTALHNALATAAERQSCNWMTGPYGEVPPESTHESITVHANAYASYFPPDPKLLDRGGIAKCACDIEHLQRFGDTVRKGQADGEDIRVRQKKLPMKLLVVDDHTALVPLGPYGHPALLIRSRPLVAVFQRFFDLVWDTATPYEPDAKKRKAAKTSGVSDKILKLMADGLKDEAIARQCGISVKTVRRHIAQLMTELGARNRFAAGVAAVRRGWIDRSAEVLQSNAR